MIPVLIPTYNGGSVLPYTLASILANGGKDAVVYIADDASSDDTLERAQHCWDGTYPLRILAFQDNLGECGNTNRALTYLRAEGVTWVILLHQDDLLTGEWLTVANTRLANVDVNTAVVCCHGTTYGTTAVSSEPPPLGTSAGSVLPSTWHPAGIASLRALRHRWFWVISGSAIQVSAICAVGGLHPGLKFAGDVDLLCRLYTGGYGVLEVHVVGILKRLHDASQTACQERAGADVIGWAYLMHRYIEFSSRWDRSREYQGKIRLCLRRIVFALLKAEVQLSFLYCCRLNFLITSYIAVMLHSPSLAPKELRRLLAHKFTDLRTSPLAEPRAPLRRTSPGHR